MIVIENNGSKSAGESPDSIDQLLERLAAAPLDPTFEDYGNFVMPARGSRHVRGYDDNGTYVDYYEDLGPIYPEAPDAVMFWGNFFAISARFGIYTDEAELIDRLTAAIRANQQRPDYLEAKTDRERQKRTRQQTQRGA